MGKRERTRLKKLDLVSFSQNEAEEEVSSALVDSGENNPIPSSSVIGLREQIQKQTFQEFLN